MDFRHLEALVAIADEGSFTAAADALNTVQSNVSGQIRQLEDEIVVVSSGEGQTSEGEFWEALNTACMLKLPVVFVIQDNEYAISTPVEARVPT